MVLEGYCRESLELARVLRRAWAAAGAEGAVEEQITQLLAFNRCVQHLGAVLAWELERTAPEPAAAGPGARG
jgi:hypothetical protein